MAQKGAPQLMTLRQRLLAARARLIAAGVDQNEAVLDTNLLAPARARL